MRSERAFLWVCLLHHGREWRHSCRQTEGVGFPNENNPLGIVISLTQKKIGKAEAQVLSAVRLSFW